MSEKLKLVNVSLTGPYPDHCEACGKKMGFTIHVIHCGKCDVTHSVCDRCEPLAWTFRELCVVEAKGDRLVMEMME